jgi:tetratricopeptide (TPR) repeat protein
VYKKLKQFDLAGESHQKALSLRRALAKESPLIGSYQSDLLASLNSLGSLSWEMNQLEEARMFYGESFRISEAIYQADQAPESAAQLAQSYLKMGDCLALSEKPADALAWFEKSLSLLMPYLEKQRSNTVFLRVLIESYTGEGWILSKFQNKHDDALKAYDSALELSTGQDADWIRAHRACVLARQGHHKEAVDLIEPLVEKNKNNVEILHDAASVYALAAASVKAGSIPPGEDRDQLVNGYEARALELITMAKEKGYFNTPQKADGLLLNKDFESLRKAQSFQKLAKKLWKENEK